MEHLLGQVLLALSLVAAFLAGLATGRWVSREAAHENRERIDLALEHLRTSRGTETILSSVVSQTKETTETVARLGGYVDRMDLSIGKMADILVQTGRARVLEFDAQVGETEKPPQPRRRRFDPDESTVIPGEHEAPT